jgi:hypothetical protein
MLRNDIPWARDRRAPGARAARAKLVELGDYSVDRVTSDVPLVAHPVSASFALAPCRLERAHDYVVAVVSSADLQRPPRSAFVCCLIPLGLLSDEKSVSGCLDRLFALEAH